MSNSPIPKRTRLPECRPNNTTNTTRITRRVSKRKGKFDHQTHSDFVMLHCILILTSLFHYFSCRNYA